MKKLLNFTLILMVFTLFVSCDKEMETDIEIIENQLKSFVNDNNITKCSIILMHGAESDIEYSDVDFSITNGFVIIKGYVAGKEYEDRYNLLFLSRYILHTNNTLGLYFANTN